MSNVHKARKHYTPRVNLIFRGHEIIRHIRALNQGHLSVHMCRSHDGYLQGSFNLKLCKPVLAQNMRKLLAGGLAASREGQLRGDLTALKTALTPFEFVEKKIIPFHNP